MSKEEFTKRIKQDLKAVILPVEVPKDEYKRVTGYLITIGFFDRFCNQKPTKKLNNWSKEFDEEYKKLISPMMGNDNARQIVRDKIKQFIHSLLKAQKSQTLQTLKKEVEGMNIGEKESRQLNYDEHSIYVFNQALSQVKDLIDKYENKQRK